MRPFQDVTVPKQRRLIKNVNHPLPILQRYVLDSETGCWEWLGARLNNGYGRCKVGNRNVQAHRAFYLHHVGVIPDGHDIHHRCGNRGCVNPVHLEPLTRGENTRTSPHGHTILNWEAADEIRVAMDALCRKYGVRPRTLAAIAERKIWDPAEQKGGDA